MDRIVGIETEYGCLLSDDEPHGNSDLWPAKVKNYLFRRAAAGTIDLHYRDYEEPPGNGGFLLNGGRLYLDMGQTFADSLEKSCRTDTGFAALVNVETRQQRDDMESFFLAETLKYLYLLYAPKSTLDLHTTVFNTEAHPIRRTW